jgi:hypothetical protein
MSLGDERREVAHLEGLSYDAVSTERDGSTCDLRRPVRRHHDDCSLRRQAPDAREQIQIVRIGQAVVENDHVKGSVFIQGAKRRRAIRRFLHRMARFRERLGERPANQRLVVDDKNPEVWGIFHGVCVIFHNQARRAARRDKTMARGSQETSQAEIREAGELAFSQRQADGDRSATARRTLDMNVSVVGFDEPFHRGESKAGAARLRGHERREELVANFR